MKLEDDKRITLHLARKFKSVNAKWLAGQQHSREGYGDENVSPEVYDKGNSITKKQTSFWWGIYCMRELSILKCLPIPKAS